MITITDHHHEGFLACHFVTLSNGWAFTIGSSGLQGYTSEAQREAGDPDLPIDALAWAPGFPPHGWEARTATEETLQFANGWRFSTVCERPALYDRIGLLIDFAPVPKDDD